MCICGTAAVVTGIWGQKAPGVCEALRIVMSKMGVTEQPEVYGLLLFGDKKLRVFAEPHQ